MPRGPRPFSSRCMTPADWDAIYFFKPHEFKEPGKMGYEFMLWLDRVRAIAQVPMHITSSYRTPEHNEEIGGAKQSAHMCIPCNCVDILPRDTHERFMIEYAALKMGCKRKGNYISDGSLHIDRCEDHLPANVSWIVKPKR